ncbi:hypothetical protein MPSEU_000109000 [Mayamaea pseudoterrestris]|nr:hypothetical protein MPSEU_000109000 [Mayamaea pseudoterrestris]
MIRMCGCWKLLNILFIHNLLPCFNTATNAAITDAAMINDKNDYYYDYTILDPQSAFGTPYGGWSRDSQSRIASLPLALPSSKQEQHDENSVDRSTESSTTTKYMHVRDAHGQLYACRVYAEDELDPTSVLEGMFDPPRLRAVDTSDETKGLSADKDEHLLGSDIEHNHETEATPTMDAILDLFAMNKILHKLKGFCAHLHTGWWSYEWCYGKHVTQFHMSLENDRVKASDLTNLGKYSSRTIDTNVKQLPINQLAQGEEETARITETYTGGDVCSDTNTPRVATVTMVCCNQEVMAKHQSKYKAKSQQAAATGDGDDNSALETVVHAVHESETCEYEIVVCTRLLCASAATANLDADATFRILSGAKDSPFGKTRPRNENESVREMLDRNLANVCIQTATTGWWTYEFCHGSRVRQFHIEFTTSKTVTELPFAAHVVASEHILGNFQQEQSESYLSEHEHKSVVNATATNRGADKGGNGAYFEVEYASGDVCDESEVTERAIVAGGVSSSGSKISRSSSVRYYCGHSFTLSVNEDSTCHYVVEVTVPDLCHHALFKAPAMVKQVVKCLPVDEENVINAF